MPREWLAHFGNEVRSKPSTFSMVVPHTDVNLLFPADRQRTALSRPSLSRVKTNTLRPARLFFVPGSFESATTLKASLVQSSKAALNPFPDLYT